MAEKTVTEMQTEFKPIVEELGSRVKELRELKAQLEEERGVYGEGLAETQGSIEKLSNEIAELRAKQEEIRVGMATPRLSTKEADEIEQDKRTGAFLQFLRFSAGVGDPLTDEQRKALYPDGRKYSFSGARGEWTVRTPEQARALVADTTGQILIPEALDAAIIRAAADLAVIRPLATVRTVSSDRERYRKVTEFTMAYGEALETGGTVTESDTTPTEHYQYVENGYGLARVGVNQLEDSDVDLIAFIQDSFARAKADIEDEKFIGGAGHGSYEPEGLTNGATITRVAAGAAAAIDFDDIRNLMYGTGGTVLHSTYRNNGVFIMHPFTELELMTLRDDSGGAGTGMYLWHPSLVAGQPNTILGKPVYTSTDVEEVGTGNDSVIFGDIRSCYRIIDRRGMKVQRLVEVYATAGLVGFLFSFRNTGGIIRAEAARILEHP